MENNDINVREIVLDMLLEVQKEQTHSHVLLKNVLDKYAYIKESDRAFIKRLFEGTLERMITIDYMINRFSNTPVNKMKPLIRCLMRMSVYQIVYMDRVPDSAAINEAVKLAKKRKFVNLSGFVNGVLRNISRNKEGLPGTEDMGIVYSCPEIIVDSLTADYGYEKAGEILAASMTDRQLFVRVREDISEAERMSIFEDWRAAGIEADQSGVCACAYAVSGNTDMLTRQKSFEAGLYTIQDESAQLAVELAGIRPGMRVLDICAAPGGKALQAAGKGAYVEARDVSDAKVSLIEDNAKRLGLDINTKVWDATVFDEASVEGYELVIADLPCSGFGVMGKKPDIKQGVTKEGLDSLKGLQRSILDNALRYVKRGGTLMYSTCTLRKAENEEQTAYILGSGLYELIEERTIFNAGHDGFYIAKFKRND